MQIVNQYSMLWSGVIIMGAAAFFILRKGYTLKKGLGLLAIAALLLTGWLFLRPQQASTVGMTQFQAELNGGLPVLLELQSPF